MHKHLPTPYLIVALLKVKDGERVGHTFISCYAIYEHNTN